MENKKVRNSLVVKVVKFLLCLGIGILCSYAISWVGYTGWWLNDLVINIVIFLFMIFATVAAGLYSHSTSWW